MRPELHGNLRSDCILSDKPWGRPILMADESEKIVYCRQHRPTGDADDERGTKRLHREGIRPRGAHPTPLREMRSLGYPRCRKNGGHDAGGPPSGDRKHGTGGDLALLEEINPLRSIDVRRRLGSAADHARWMEPGSPRGRMRAGSPLRRSAGSPGQRDLSTASASTWWVLGKKSCISSEARSYRSDRDRTSRARVDGLQET